MKLPFGVKSWGYGKNVNREVKAVPLGDPGCNEAALPEVNAPKSKPGKEKDPALHFTIQHFGSNHHSHGWSKGR